jgi:hypothetical protein
MRQTERPELISTILDKKKVWLNIRESRLMYMYNRKLISMEEYEAGSRYRLMCELQGGPVSNFLRDRIDGSRPDQMAMRMGAAFAIKEVDDELGYFFCRIMKFFCWANYGIIEIANMLERSERKTSYYVHEGLSRLSVYYGYKKIRHTIRGQGTKTQRQKVS